MILQLIFPQHLFWIAWWSWKGFIICCHTDCLSLTQVFFQQQNLFKPTNHQHDLLTQPFYLEFKDSFDPSLRHSCDWHLCCGTAMIHSPIQIWLRICLPSTWHLGNSSRQPINIFQCSSVSIFRAHWRTILSSDAKLWTFYHVFDMCLKLRNSWTKTDFTH